MNRVQEKLEEVGVQEVKPVELTLAEYINLQRIAAGIAYGPIPELYNTMDWINEYKLIQEKKSKLSAKKRAVVSGTVESATVKYNEDKANGNTERYDQMNRVIGKFRMFTESVRRMQENV